MIHREAGLLLRLFQRTGDVEWGTAGGHRNRSNADNFERILIQELVNWKRPTGIIKGSNWVRYNVRDQIDNMGQIKGRYLNYCSIYYLLLVVSSPEKEER